MVQRLQKLLAASGIGSRRSCEELVAAGRVSVNGKQITEVGASADPDLDDIRLDGKPIPKTSEHVYIVLNKPTGYVSTVKDRHAAHTVMDLVKGITGRLYPVGRLDADSAGLLILTNDGAFTERLTHPSHQVPKTYRAVVRGEVPEWAAVDLRKGVILDDGMTAPAEIEWVDYDPRNNASIIDVTIHEGRNRQVRRMFAAVGYPVLALTRMQIGPLTLKGLAPGSWRKLHPSEVAALLAAADSGPASLPQTPVDVPEEPQPERRAHRPVESTGVRAEAAALTKRLESNRDAGSARTPRPAGTDGRNSKQRRPVTRQGK